MAIEGQVDISLWRNMDQNENQVTHDIDILQRIKATAEHFSQKQAKVTQGDLVACVSRGNLAKVSPLVLMHLCKFFMGFLDNGVVDLVTDLVDSHFHTVDLRELTVSTSFFQSLVSEEALPKCSQTRLYLVMTQYTLKKTRAQVGGPSVAQFLDTSLILGLCKKPDLLKAIETNIRDSKGKYLPSLVLSLG